MSTKERTRTKRGARAPKEHLPKEAYISAPSNFDTRPIRRAFEAKGVKTFAQTARVARASVGCTP